jgi:23S rRNA pseudouridine1911/1915/1917 synthase
VKKIEYQWLAEATSLKEALKEVLGSSNQHLKKFYSNKQLQHIVQSKDILDLPLELVNHLLINPSYTGPEVRIIAETGQYLALHKPPGVHCHPHSYADTQTILNYLASKKNYSPLLVNQGNYDRGLLYRLDLETSGVLILVKNPRLHHEARENFASSVKRKFYWAIVEGNFDQEGPHTHFFKGSGPKGAKQKVSSEEGEETQEGSLGVKKILTSSGKSLLLVSLRTGLRHQIRAQLSHLGFPILGDELYGGNAAERLFLHAFRYEWLDVIEDVGAELFESFFDLDRALKMSHDVLREF